MKTAYRILAYLIALEVLVQAGAIAYALAGLGTWIQHGGVLDKAAMESETTDFPGVVGFMVHGMNGMMITPVIALLLFIVSFFAHVRGGVQLAAIVLGAVAVQVTLGIFSHGMPWLAGVHGVLAVLLFGVALYAAHRAGTRATAAESSHRHAAGVG
jgi:hypothetical protein